MKKVYITKIHIDDKNVSELDFVLDDEFGVNSENEEYLDELLVGQGRADGYPINIDTLFNLLTELKNDGCTHVELDYHSDHIGYDISGYIIRKSTKDEMPEFRKQINKF
jgi:hypothetical protein